MSRENLVLRVMDVLFLTNNCLETMKKSAVGCVAYVGEQRISPPIYFFLEIKMFT